MARKISRKGLIKALDTVTSLIIRARDKRCVQCGTKEKPTNGHVLPGRYHALRWDIRDDGNCHQQCWPCNYTHVRHQSHYYSWYIKKFGLKRFEQLKYEYYGSIKKFSDKELREMLEEYKIIYADIQNRSAMQ